MRDVLAQLIDDLLVHCGEQPGKIRPQAMHAEHGAVVAQALQQPLRRGESRLTRIKLPVVAGPNIIA